MLKMYKSENGFTLIEIIMVTAILSILIAIVYNFLNFNFKFADERNKEYDSYLEAKIAMDRMQNLLKNFKEIDIDHNNVGEKVVFGRVVGAVSVGAGDFNELINFDNNEQKSDVDDYVYYFYYPSTHDYGQILNSNQTVIADGVKRFNFIKDPDTGLLSIEIEVVRLDMPDDLPLKLYTSIELNRDIVPN